MNSDTSEAGTFLKIVNCAFFFGTLMGLGKTSYFSLGPGHKGYKVLFAKFGFSCCRSSLSLSLFLRNETAVTTQPRHTIYVGEDAQGGRLGLV